MGSDETAVLAALCWCNFVCSLRTNLRIEMCRRGIYRYALCVLQIFHTRSFGGGGTGRIASAVACWPVRGKKAHAVQEVMSRRVLRTLFVYHVPSRPFRSCLCDYSWSSA